MWPDLPYAARKTTPKYLSKLYGNRCLATSYDRTLLTRHLRICCHCNWQLKIKNNNTQNSSNVTSISNRNHIASMRGSRKFCQKGSNFDDGFFFFLVDDGREDPNTTTSGPSSARWRADDGQTLNAGLVAVKYESTTAEPQP